MHASSSNRAIKALTDSKPRFKNPTFMGDITNNSADENLNNDDPFYISKEKPNRLKFETIHKSNVYSNL